MVNQRGLAADLSIFHRQQFVASKAAVHGTFRSSTPDKNYMLCLDKTLAQYDYSPASQVLTPRFASFSFVGELEVAREGLTCMRPSAATKTANRRRPPD